MKNIEEVLRKLDENSNKAMAGIKGAEVIKNQLLVVSAADEEELKALKNYAQIHKVTNLFIFDGSKKATFLGEESNCLYFTNFFTAEYGPYALSEDVWEIELELEDVFSAEDIRKKFASRDFHLGEMSSYAFVLSHVSQMRSRWANSIREGFGIGMKEPRYVEYKLYCMATILEKHIEENCACRSGRDKMALTLMKQELEDLIQSKDYKVCQEMYACGICSVLTNYVQRFVEQMHILLQEITE